MLAEFKLECDGNRQVEGVARCGMVARDGATRRRRERTCAKAESTNLLAVPLDLKLP